MLYYVLTTAIIGALCFVLGRRTTILKWLPMSAETSAAWDVIRAEG